MVENLISLPFYFFMSSYALSAESSVLSDSESLPLYAAAFSVSVSISESAFSQSPSDANSDDKSHLSEEGTSFRSGTECCVIPSL